MDLDNLEAEDPQLMSSASSTVAQQRLYQAAMFTGCKDGEFEVGMMSTASNINMQMGIRNMPFTEGFAQQSSHLGEFIHHDQSWFSSSSSSLRRSPSVDSPEYSSLILSNATSTGSPRMPPGAHRREPSVEQVVMTQPRSAHLVPPHQVAMQAYGQACHVQFPTPTGDVDAAMARALISVISSSDQQNQERWPWDAFKPYDGSSQLPKTEAMQVSQGQGMMKRAFSIMRQIGAPAEETGRQGSNQLNHVMSERKRREKLNESFSELRESLPPGTKRDKASVLANTIDFVNILKAEISELEGKNRVLEARLLPPDETDEEEETDRDNARSGERVRIEIDRAPRCSSGLQPIELRVMARVEYSDMTDLVLQILECLKKMRGVKLVSLDSSVHSRQMNPIRRAILTMQVKGGNWDEDSFKRAIARAVQEASSRRPETAAT